MTKEKVQPKVMVHLSNGNKIEITTFGDVRKLKNKIAKDLTILIA